jgi:hypothetical protein
VIEFDAQDASSAEFRLALQSLRSADIREELIIEEIAAPPNLATNAIAFSASVAAPAVEDVSTDLGTGRFVLLWEPQEQEGWANRFRVICFAKSPLETNIGADESISDVSWAWLTEALENRGAEFAAEAGTATRIISSGYGALAVQSDHAELEMRASWSPVNIDVAAHLEAWQDLVCIMSGFPHLPVGVSKIAIRARS